MRNKALYCLGAMSQRLFCSIFIFQSQESDGGAIYFGPA